MAIARITVELEIPHAQSLKDRRQAVRSIKEKLRSRFNASVAEMDQGLVLNRATLGIAAISASPDYLQRQCEAIERALYAFTNQHGVTLTDVYAEIVEDAVETG